MPSAKFALWLLLLTLPQDESPDQDSKGKGIVFYFSTVCVRNKISNGLNPKSFDLGPIIFWHLSRGKPFIQK